MFLTSHRVVRPGTKEEGVNSFLYRHGNYVWDGYPPAQFFPDQNPGELVRTHVEVSPPGNHVRSYLDIVTPDEVTEAEIRRALGAFLERARAQPLPWVGVIGRCFVRVGMERGLAKTWRDEIASLYRHAAALRLQAV